GEAGGGWIRDLEALPLGAKVLGARALDALLPDVELFVVFSSAIAGFGRAGAAAYAAQNAALDAIVTARVARGAHGLSIGWGPWDTGMARAGAWTADGVTPLSTAVGIAALEQALRTTGVVTVFQAEGPTVAGWYAGRPPPWLGGWPGLPEPTVAKPTERTPAALTREITELVARLVGRDTVPPTLGLFDAGLDSLLAVELARRLSRAFGVPVPSTVAFDHPDVERLTRFVSRLLGVGPAERPAGPARAGSSDDPIAIVGMACRFPGAADPEALWDLLMHGQVAIRDVPADRWRLDDWFDPTPGRVGKMYARGGGFLDDLTQFDPEFFGISAREAPTLDPQQRLLLEVGWEALERAGLAGASLRESPTGVYVGIADRGYLHRFHQPGEPLYPDAWAGTGTEPSFAAGRLAYVLGVHGPALALNTTCSSSLVAVHLAAAALRRGECDTALAGGVALMLLPDDTAYLCALRALSPTDRCHTFDAAADGYARGEGAGMVVLRRLSDARRDGNPVLAVLLGSAVNHDGPSSGLTVPNGAAQEQVLRAALADAGVTPDRVGYLEAHGTGTSLGDPIEVHAANAVYGDRSEPLLLGAVKANLGHLELAAGMASLVKAVTALQRGVVPPHPTFTTPNPAITFGRAVVPTAPTPLAPGALAAVSAFGLSGTNAHLVLGPAPGAPPGPTAGADRTTHVVALSAGSAPALVALARGWIGRGAPADVAAAAHRRRVFGVRAAVVASDPAELDRKLAEVTPVTARRGTLGFLFGGQGTQFAGMGLGWDAASPVFRAALDRCASVVDPLLGVPLREVLASADLLGSTRYAQPALMAVQLALVELLRSVGITPSAVAGHSLGELVACTVAGVWSVEDALRLAVARGQLMEEHGLPGMMAAVGASADAVRELLVPGAEIAAINADDEVVIAGPEDAVELVLASLPTGVSARKLGTGRPFHTACLDPMLDPWEAAVAAVPARRPQLPVVSLCTGALAADELTTAAFWRRHAREPVRCADGLRALFASGVDTLLDVGAHPVLLQLAQRNADRPGLRFAATGRRDVDPWRTLSEALGALFEAGEDPDWAAWDSGLPRHWIDGPTTPFDRRRFWLEERVSAVGSTYGVQWVADASPARVAPTAVDADLGPVLSGSRALTGRGRSIVAVSPTSPLPAQLVDLGTFADEPGEFVVVTRGAVEGDPYARAVTAFARCLSLERAEPVRTIDLGPDGGHADLLLGLACAETEVAVRGGRRLVPRLERVSLPPAAPSLSGTWLVTGGLGAVGSAFARWLRARGVERVVVTTRTAVRPGDPRSDTVNALRATGLELVVAVADVADEEALATLLAAHPVDGVVHAAGVTEPQLVAELTAEVVARTVEGKVNGAINLDHLLADRPLQGFVLVSSIAGVWGSRALAAYAAANAYLDGLAAARRARGLQATAVAFGPWAGGGMVDADRAAELARAGLSLLPPEPTLERVGAALASGRANTVIVDADWGTLVNALEVRGPRPMFASLRPAAPPPAPVAISAGIVDQIVALPESEREAALIPHLERRARAVLHLDPSRPL
ncbi:MAG: SDR family NAD(P)-dependent oxidoreductase, partial [Myxococcota bacterium]